MSVSPAVEHGTPVMIRVLSNPRLLPVVRGAMERVCELAGLSDTDAGSVVLSVDEALTNIIRHAYDGAEDKPIEITAEMLPLGSGLKICLRDYGRQVDPKSIKSRDLADVRPGGLGVHIICQCMDSVEYSQAPGGGTLLTLVKELPPGGNGK